MNAPQTTITYQEVSESVFYATVNHRDMAITWEKGTFPRVAIYKFKRTDTIFGKIVDAFTANPRHIPKEGTFYLAIETLPTGNKQQ